ncbi:MAG: MBOAT family protein [Lachnospiraceae bacterium]|nr:MBOAT family protein [Lachnospiraceae bacterium]
MLFNSLAFAVFLPIVFFLYWALPNKYRPIWILIASYYFYMSWNVKYVVLILFTTVISYGCAILMQKWKKKKTVLLCGTLIASLGVLFFFKYFNFFSISAANVLSRFAIQVHPVTLSLMLPVGISFYTFQTLSYVIDVYRGDVEAEKNFITYAAFISFFPQLVAGPIERTKNLFPQIKGEHRFDKEQVTYGLLLMAWGFFKKLVVADNLAIYADQIFDDVHYYGGFSMLMAALFFTFQIYCDFSGYSDIAIGCAKLFDIRLMTNFRSPYFAISIKDFWSRWHISLSTWFRDYVYIPLGGNRVNKVHNAFNLMVTFLVSGLWHGAAWHFVVWGGLHGALQVLENCFPFMKKLTRRAKENPESLRGPLIWFCRMVTFVTAMLAWVFFRAGSVSDACYVLLHMWDGISSPVSYVTRGLTDFGMGVSDVLSLAIPFLILVAYDYIALREDPIAKLRRLKKPVRWVIYYGFIFLVLMFASFNAQEFVYFQF